MKLLLLSSSSLGGREGDGGVSQLWGAKGKEQESALKGVKLLLLSSSKGTGA